MTKALFPRAGLSQGPGGGNLPGLSLPTIVELDFKATDDVAIFAIQRCVQKLSEHEADRAQIDLANVVHLVSRLEDRAGAASGEVTFKPEALLP